jgi:hypothetical protein
MDDGIAGAPVSPADSVKSWLAGTGFPLEWQVAAAFRQANMAAEAGRPYVDPVTDTIREIDVTVAVAGGAVKQATWSYFVIECKDVDRPWAIFTEDGGGSIINRDRIWEATVTHEWGNAPDLDLPELVRRSPLLKPPSNLGYAVKALPSPKGTPKSERPPDFARDALLGVSSAALGIIRDFRTAAQASDREGARVIVHAAVVTTAPLVLAHMDAQGEVHCEEVTRAAVLHRPTVDPAFRLVHIVHTSALDVFIADCRDTATAPTRMRVDILGS